MEGGERGLKGVLGPAKDDGGGAGEGSNGAGTEPRGAARAGVRPGQGRTDSGDTEGAGEDGEDGIETGETGRHERVTTGEYGQ